MLSILATAPQSLGFESGDSVCAGNLRFMLEKAMSTVSNPHPCSDIHLTFSLYKWLLPKWSLFISLSIVSLRLCYMSQVHVCACTCVCMWCWVLPISNITVDSGLSLELIVLKQWHSPCCIVLLSQNSSSPLASSWSLLRRVSTRVII